MGQCGNYLGFAVATEEGLQRTAHRYARLGYRYQAQEWEKVSNREKLAQWLRWANPDDGWHFAEFPRKHGVAEALGQLVTARAFGEEACELEEFYVEVLTSLRTDARWVRCMAKRPVVVGTTYGEDPRNFLRTATMCNSYPMIQQLWSQYAQADELEHRISRARS